MAIFVGGLVQIARIEGGNNMELARAVVIDPEGDPIYQQWELKADAQDRLDRLRVNFGHMYEYRLETK